MKIGVDIPKKLLPIVNSKKRNIVLYGGRGGAKSWAVAAVLIIKALEKSNQIILCTREIQNTIQDSVHSVLKQTIDRLGLKDHFEITDKKIQCVNGTKFIFKGLHRNITEVKSTEGVDYCWVEEAHSISQSSIDVLWPTVRKPGSQFFVTFNPDQEDDPIYSMFVKDQKRNDTLLINVNYYDNPFFGEPLKSDMEYDREYNYDKYLHVWDGQCKSVTDACIFKDKFTVCEFETHDDVQFFYGADWGFSNDPSAVIRCYIYDQCLYIDYEAGGIGVEFEELPQLWDSVPLIREHKVVADSSRPDTISYMNRQGFTVRRSRKGKNSIEDGIEFIRSFRKIYIHTRCKNTAYEFKSYSYKQDPKTEEILPIIIDKDNHYIDSTRYSLEDSRKGRGDPYGPPVGSIDQLFGKKNVIF